MLKLYSILLLALNHNISFYGNNFELSPNTNRVVVRRGPRGGGVAASRRVEITFVHHFGLNKLLTWTPQNHSVDSFRTRSGISLLWSVGCRFIPAYAGAECIFGLGRRKEWSRKLSRSEDSNLTQHLFSFFTKSPNELLFTRRALRLVGGIGNKTSLRKTRGREASVPSNASNFVEGQNKLFKHRESASSLSQITARILRKASSVCSCRKERSWIS